MLSTPARVPSRLLPAMLETLLCGPVQQILSPLSKTLRFSISRKFGQKAGSSASANRRKRCRNLF